MGVLIAENNGYPALPLNADGEIRYHFIKSFSGVNKKILYDRIHEWAALTFGNINSVLHYENYENGKIILKGHFEISHKLDYKNFWGRLKEGVSNRTCYQTYIFTLLDDKVKIQIIDLTYEWDLYNYTGSSYITIPTKQSIHGFYPITDGDYKQWKERLDILYQTKLEIDDIVNSLEGYIKDVHTDYKF